MSSLPARVTRVDAPIVAPAAVIELGRQERARKLWHMSAGLIPFICPLLPYYDRAADFWGPNILRLMILSTAGVLVGLSCWHAKKFTRAGEKGIGVAMGCYVACVVAMLVAFPWHLELGMTVLAVLAIGDGAAGWIGMTLKGPKLPWNSAKSVSGTIGFLVCATPVASCAYWIGAHPSVSWSTAFGLGACTCLAGALAESLPAKVNDNLRIGMAAAGVVVLHQWTIGGF